MIRSDRNDCKEEIMKKQRKLGIVLLLCLSLLAGCGKGGDKEPPEATKGAEPEVQKQEITVAALKGPTAIGMVKLMEDSEAGLTAGTYQFQIAGTADELTSGIVKGDIQIAAIPCNLASVLYNRMKGGLMLAGINTLGVLYIVETGDSIHSVADLKGKTIYSTGKGTTPEFTLNYILKKNGLDPEKDVTIEYKSEATEIAALLSKGSDAVAMLPQPYVTTVTAQNEAVRIALDVTEEWDKITEDGSSLVTGVVVVNSSFYAEHPEAVEAFLKEYKESAGYVNEQVENAAELVEKYDIFKAAVAKKAIPYCNIVWIDGTEMKEKVNGYLNVLYEQNPDSVGGSLPGEDFYYIPE